VPRAHKLRSIVAGDAASRATVCGRPDAASGTRRWTRFAAP